MTAFGQRMDKILREQENATIITNPKDQVRTFFRKMAYRLDVIADWTRRLFTRQSDENHR
jgi:hypothetical protein